MTHSPTFDSQIDTAAPNANLHILVIDGDDAAGSLLQATLEAAGYDVTVADMPDIGLIRRVEPDAVVLGLMYRGEPNGLDFLERHVADPMTARVPVVVRASASELTDAQRARLTALPHAFVAMTAPDSALRNELARVLTQKN
jgi:CheY-like chemotaxis protein